ncbi:MAG: ankyrin repeat domain-containing protein [Propionivibrio sp.]
MLELAARGFSISGFVRSGAVLVIGAWLAIGVARAELPDPVAFSWAVESNNVNKVTAWLDEGLDPDFMSKPLGSGLMIAAWNGNIPMMELFVARGANPRRANENGEQPLQLAAWNGHLDAVKWLLGHGAVINREGNNWSALHYAVFNGHSELANYLLERGADVNARSPNRSTPLMLAARENREELAKVLLEAGADTKAMNDWGDTPLTMAMRYEHFRLGKMISSPEEFAIAVKAPKESFGEAQRSASAPSEIEELLRKIREAEAEGRPSEELHKQLLAAVNAFRRNAMAVRNANARQAMPLPYQPKSIVITAKRGNPAAERAQVVSASSRNQAQAKAPAGKGKPSITITPVNEQRQVQAQIAETMRQIRLAEAQGQPADELRRKLSELVDSMK